jgi:pimeloyl-ACP methyl ester carboxylesterase
VGDPAPVVVEHDGLRIAALDWGGDGEPLVLLHPTGFCAGFFDPLARRLRDTYRPIGVDLRGHGGTDVPDLTEAHRYSFVHMARDVLAVLDHIGIASCSSLGFSGGGGVGTLVDQERPQATRRLVLCEAIAFDLDAVARPRGTAPGDGGNYMANIARKRRPVWPDRTTVRASYGSRPPLDVLAPEFLDAYVQWGFVDRDDGQVELACPPSAEAMVFEVAADEQGSKAAWAHLAHLSCEAVVLAGTTSDLPQEWFRGQAEKAHAPFVAIDGGHFFLHEDLDRAEALAREHLAA